MNIPLPDGYGDLLSRDDGASFRVFATLAGVVLLVATWFIVGALLQAIGRWWKRNQDVSPPRPPRAP